MLNRLPSKKWICGWVFGRYRRAHKFTPRKNPAFTFSLVNRPMTTARRASSREPMPVCVQGILLLGVNIELAKYH